jgi:hypothetical protein
VVRTPSLRRAGTRLALLALTLSPAPAQEQLPDIEPLKSSITVTGKISAETPGVNLDDRLRELPGFSLFRRSSSLVAHPTTLGVFAQSSVGAGPAKLFLGARYDYRLSPSVGFAVGRGKVRARGSAYRSFRAPTLNELYRDFRYRLHPDAHNRRPTPLARGHSSGIVALCRGRACPALDSSPSEPRPQGAVTPATGHSQPNHPKEDSPCA